MNSFSMKAEQFLQCKFEQINNKSKVKTGRTGSREKSSKLVLDWSNLFLPGAQSRLEAIRTQKNALIETESDSDDSQILLRSIRESKKDFEKV